jgi:hypothetical protein
LSDQLKKPPSGPLALHGSGPRAGSIIDQAVSRLSPDQANELISRAADEALKLEVSVRKIEIEYAYGRKAAEDHIDTFKMLDKEGKATRQVVKSDIKTGAGNMRIESKSGPTCFVASAAYGDVSHPDVAFLRHYRDGVLAARPLGRWLIKWYWRNGPKLAVLVLRNPRLKRVARFAIARLVRVLKSLS